MDHYFQLQNKENSYSLGNRKDIINYLIEKNKYKSYLEIGTRSVSALDSVYCENKIYSLYICIHLASSYS